MVLTIFAGINGAGKSTLYRSLQSREYLGARINWDDIARNDGEDNPTGFNYESGKKVIRMIDYYFARKKPFSIEVTLCTLNLFKTIAKAKRNGYYIILRYVYLDSPDLAIQRMAGRVNKNGHGIPEEVLRYRYDKSLGNLSKTIRLCDEAYIFDNSDQAYGFQFYAFFFRGRPVYVRKNIPKQLAAFICKNVLIGDGN